MLPAGVDAVVVVVVHACDVVADVLGAVVVIRSALILGVDILEDEAAQPSAVLQVELGAEHHVLQTVHEVAALLPCVPLFALAVAVVVEQEHLAVVFEEVVGVYREAPQVGVEVQTRHPTAQLVAGAVGVDSVGCVAAARYESVPEVLYARAGRYALHVAVAVATIGLAAELARHLQSQFEAEREERVLVAYLQIARLGVVEHVVGVFLLLVGEVVLPAVVGHHAVGDVSLKVKPALCTGDGPVFGQGDAHLRHWSGVDA